MAIDKRKVSELEQDYRAGYNTRQASIRCDVFYGTVRRYYLRFADLGIPHKARAERQRKADGRYGQAPVYTGPDWIGLPA